MKKILFSAALLMGISAAASAGAPKGETKDTKEIPSESKASSPVVKWFHFTGDASDPDQINDPSLYTAEASPTCSSTTVQYRCDIQVLSNDDQTEPDLSKTIQSTRYRSNP